MKNKKKKTASIMGVAAACCLTVSSLAVFTDRFQSQAEVTAGSLDLTLIESWQADNAALADVFKPGTGLKLDYNLVNDGYLAASVREQFVISADKALAQGEDREIDLYAAEDVVLDTEGNVIQINGEPLDPAYDSFKEDSQERYTLSYSLDELILNGTKNSGESVAEGLDSRDGEYVLVFNNDVDNAFQNVNLDIEYMAQGLQHGNTGAETWNDAKVISEKVHFGGQDVHVVPTVEEGSADQ